MQPWPGIMQPWPGIMQVVLWKAGLVEGWGLGVGVGGWELEFGGCGCDGPQVAPLVLKVALLPPRAPKVA